MARRSPLKSIIDALVMLAAMLLVVFLYRGLVLKSPEDGPVKVIDGDSLRRGETEIRLHGIDAPEFRQTCKDARQREFACGQEAASALKRLVAGRDVSCKPVEHDRYNRLVALCSAGKTLLNEEMVRQGWAVAYLIHSSKFTALETEARSAKRGIWQGEFERPQHYRERTRNLVRGNAAGIED